MEAKKLSPGPGPGPTWALAHLGPGHTWALGPGPTWGMAHLGPGPTWDPTHLGGRSKVVKKNSSQNALAFSGKCS